MAFTLVSVPMAQHWRYGGNAIMAFPKPLADECMDGEDARHGKRGDQHQALGTKDGAWDA